MLAEVLCRALTALGRDVIDAGVAATPTTGVLVRQLQAAGGIQISASHNPPQYNGLKLFLARRPRDSRSGGPKVLNRYRENARLVWPAPSGPATPISVPTRRVGMRTSCWRPSTSSGFGDASSTCCSTPITARAAYWARKLLTDLGCNVTILGGTPDGAFEHTPEPTAENLAGVLAAVPRAAADVGFCQDPDADRLAVIDATGRYLGEEYTLAICVDHRLRARPGRS